jgi:hypothetical protein
MANSDKNIKITPNISASGQPNIVYTGSGNVPIALKVLDDSYGTLSFEGSAGQLFSLNNNLSSGTIFSVNDISGMPQFDVNADGTIRVAPYGSGVYMGGVGGGTFTIQPSVKSSSGAGTSVAITAGNGVTSGAGGSLILQAGIQATTGGDGKVVVRQKSGQTSNLQEWQNSSSGILTSIGPSGSINLLPYGTSSGNTNEIRFNELAANGTDYVGFKAPDSISTPKIWTLPSGDGTTGQALITNGSGLLSWGTIANLSSYTNTSAATTSAYDLGTSNFVKANPSASGLTINGFSSSGSYDGRMLKLVNVSNYNINIINTGTTVCVGGNNIVLGPKDGADLILDSGASVWRVF